MAVSKDLTDLGVVVTGGARGIGLAIATRLVERGARIAIGDIDEDLAAQAALSLGERVQSARLDVTDSDSWAQFDEAVSSHLGGVDVLVNNAGIMPLGSVLDEPESVSRSMVDINLHGVVLGTQHYAPQMAARSGGQIVNVASAVGRMALAGGATYSASKFAVIGFTEATRAELAPLGVTVSAVLPTVVLTELASGIEPTRGIKPVTPEQVAAVVETAIRTGKPEMWVPRYVQGMSRATQILPRGVQNAMAKLFNADSALTGADPAARRAYEERIRPS